jgi:hypothetical protein
LDEFLEGIAKINRSIAAYKSGVKAIVCEHEARIARRQANQDARAV